MLEVPEVEEAAEKVRHNLSRGFTVADTLEPALLARLIEFGKQVR